MNWNEAIQQIYGKKTEPEVTPPTKAEPSREKNKLKFNTIPVKPGDFVYLNYMDFGDKFVLCRAEAGEGYFHENKSFKNGDQLLVRGIINNPPDWDYSSFEIGLNSRVGAKNHLFDFTEHKDSRPDRKVWIAKWNPHN